MTSPIASELGLDVSNSIWVVYAYSLPFASCLLFAGRIADLYSPSIVYSAGFLGNGILNLVISFMNDKYAFLVLRGLSALFSVFTVPSSINMIGKPRHITTLIQSPDVSRSRGTVQKARTVQSGRSASEHSRVCHRRWLSGRFLAMVFPVVRNTFRSTLRAAWL